MIGSPKKIDPFSYIGIIFLYIVIHFIAAKFGLYLNGLVPGHQVFFWPPAGISLAALLLFGYRMWPGITIGAVLASLSSGAPLPVAISTGFGSTLAPIVAVYALKHFFHFQSAMKRTYDVIALCVFAIPLSSIVLASFMTTGFWRGGIIPAVAIPNTWLSIWMSNVLSTTLVGAFILIWLNNWGIKIVNVKRTVESFGLWFAIALLGFLMFTDIIDKSITIGYFVFIPVVWAALRFGLRETITIVFVFSLMAIWSTLLGAGPSYIHNLNTSLLNLQGFISIVFATSMILATTVSERRELEQRKDNFIGMASHELKTPLTTVKMVTQLLLRNYKVKKHEVANEVEYLETVNKQVNKMTSLINDMLDVSMIQAGELKMRNEEFSLKDVLDQIVESMRMVDKNHVIVVEADFSKRIHGDKERVGQVIMNLLSNAIKYSPDGKKIIIRVINGKSYVTFSIQDQGVGISENKVHKIFERFYRSDEVKHQSGGFGLGLFISSEIIKQHGGRIWVESKEGKGSIFYFTLPLS